MSIHFRDDMTSYFEGTVGEENSSHLSKKIRTEKNHLVPLKRCFNGTYQYIFSKVKVKKCRWSLV